MSKSSRVNSVNVMEFADNILIGMKSFKDSDHGNQEAEKLFQRVIMENCPEATEEDLEVALEDGNFEQGSYRVSLSHS